MNRKKPQPNEITNYDLSPFMPHNMSKTAYENETIETLREKLLIKSESLKLLSRQLEQCNKEKNDYKRLIDQLYDKNLSLKKTLFFKENSTSNTQNDFNNNLESNSSLFNDIDTDDYTKVLKDLVKSLQKEKSELIQKNEDLNQQLIDYKADLKLLREQIVRQRVGTYLEGLTLGDFNNNNDKIKTNIPSSMSFNCLNDAKKDLIRQIEDLREEKNSIENDLKMIMCQKEELEIERDTYKDKYTRINSFVEVNSARLGLRVDEMISKNKYLSELCQCMREEMDLMRQTTRKNNEIPQNLKVQIKNLWQKMDIFVGNNENLDSKLLVLFDECKECVNVLVEGLNDKLVALQHQKKCNKILASRVQDLEKQLNILNNGELDVNSSLLINDSPKSMSKLPEPIKPNS
ncbi:unnamed protein product [Brachionus calyciflorus]|uniref:Uncharacterized protein n=1 Tax=Brachionus calyciflorus TaxID=104777 RepID=A0A814JNH2_9BILA|nr:unnamed protein product [Brachionus calyciflorus]